MRYFLNRMIQFVIVFILVTFGVMALMRLGLNKPGDPARTMLGGTVALDKAHEVNVKYHLDKPLIVQYGYWLKQMFWDRDFGITVQNSATVFNYLKPRAMVTALIGVYSLVLSLLIAVPVAVYQAYRRDSYSDRFANWSSFVFVSLPTLVLATLFRLAFTTHWKLFPVTSKRIYPWDNLGGHFKSFFLPTITLTLPIAAIFIRLLRADMIRTLQSDFITLASAKGVSPTRVLWSHALRNSLFSLLTSVGVQVGGLVGGAIIVEQFFELPGMGQALTVAIIAKDLFVVQSVAAVLVVFVLVANLLTDLSYAVIDPRIRHMRKLS